MKSNSPKKIGFLLINQYGGRGGVEKVLIQLTQALHSNGIQSHLIYSDIPVHSEFLNHFKYSHFFKKINEPPQKSVLPKFISRFLWKKFSQRQIRRQFKQIHQHLGLDTLIVINLPTNYVRFNKTINNCKKKSNIKIYSWLHGSLSGLQSDDVNYIKKSLPIYDDHLAICKGIQQELASLLNVSSQIVYNPIQEAKLVKRDPKKLLYIGRIDSNKRVHNILHMLSNIHGAWSLDIIGSTGSAQKDKEFEIYIDGLGISQKITFHGWLENPWENIDSAGLLLLNSLSEGFGLVLAEAMMRGIPCLSSDCPVGPNEIIQDGINGWLYPIDNENMGINILQDIITDKKTLPSPAIVKKSIKKFHIKSVTNNLINIINSK